MFYKKYILVIKKTQKEKKTKAKKKVKRKRNSKKNRKIKIFIFKKLVLHLFVHFSTWCHNTINLGVM